MCQYYKWTHDYVINLDADLFETYWMAITMIEAQETLLKMRLMDWPNTKKEERKKWHRSLVKMAYPDEDRTAITTDQLARRIGAMING